ncbi:motile sperm domain-containing protein 2-like [Panonychus citri]|uniref:motile sperm domain-containing protein 2-like n=1 Tax=Panonychus citri TaxID=50023 RepID=UPI002307538C|nr:motile sperm domain-containing protein 2-like [Panonychus citri]
MTRANSSSIDSNGNRIDSEGNHSCGTKSNTRDESQPKRDYSKKIEDVRSQVKGHFTENPDLYDADDLEKVFTNDFYVCRFLRWCKGDIKKSVNMILKCFQWRKSSGLIYRKPTDFPSEFYKSGGLFNYQPDLLGKPTLYMRAKFMHKVAELDAPFKDFMAYKINEIDESCGKMASWTIIIDCAEIGWANVCIDMLRYLISIMSNYFPLGLKQVIVLDIPWILDAIRKMISSMLPEEALKVVTFTSRKKLPDFVDPKNSPDFVCGTCTVPYDQVPSGCKSFDELTDDFYNLNEKQLRKLTDLYKSVMS